MFKFLLFRVLPCLLLAQTAAHSQTLYDVVISLTDRQQVINQGGQVTDYLNSQNSGQGDVVIDWVGIGTNPSQSAVDGLGIAGKIALLNQAVQEFERLKSFYLNCSAAELSAATTVGSLKPYSHGDFDPLPRTTPANYQELLVSLSQRIRALRVLNWYSFPNKTVSRHAKTHIWEEIGFHDYNDANNDGNYEPYIKQMPEGSNFVWKPATIGTQTTFLEDTVTSSESVEYDPNAQIEVTGAYTETNSNLGALKSTTIELTMHYLESVQIASTVPEGSNQIDGTVYVLRTGLWNKMSVTNTPTQFDRDQAGYAVVGSGNSGKITLFNASPDATFSGSWGVTYDNNCRFIPGGYQYLLDHIKGNSINYNKSTEPIWKVGCNFKSVFMPAFSRGLDAPTLRAKLEKDDNLLASNSSDGRVILDPRPGLLVGIQVGPGLTGVGNGLITCGSPVTGAIGNSDKMCRFDSTYSLAFAGSCSDYHVVYENNRATRSQSLPADGLISEAPSFFSAWDSPRLKQVAGRDLVADVEYNTSHYGGYTIKIYRRPLDSASPVPGQVLATSSMTLIRTWSFSHPGAGTAYNVTDAEKLVATGTGGETYEIRSNHLLLDGTIAWWKGNVQIWWWQNCSWSLIASNGTTEKLRKEINWDIETGEYTESDSVDGQLISSLSTMNTGWGGLLPVFTDDLLADWEITTAGKTITGSATLGNFDDPAYGYGKWPVSVSIQYDGIQPDATYTWDSNGLLASAIQGPWKSEGSIADNAYMLKQKFSDAVYATTWTEFTGGNKLKSYSAPDGNAGSKTDTSVAWTEVEYGNATTGLPGLPLKVTNSDGSGSNYTWSTNADGSYGLTLESGLLSGSSVSSGTKTVRSISGRGQLVKNESYLISGGTSIKTGSATTGNLTAWGIPQNSTDDLTTLVSSWSYDNNLSRVSSITNGLGLTSGCSNYDLLGRPANTSTNGINSEIHYTGTSHSATVTGSITGSLATNRDALGRITSNNTTWNGVTDNLTVAHNGASVDVTQVDSLLGTHNSSIRRDDGTSAAASGPTMAFNGVTGDALSGVSGLLVTKSAIKDRPGTYAETHSDAWGRVRKVVTPSKSGSGSTQTNYAYSLPASSLKRTIITEPSGRTLITESEASGTITRSGVDLDGDGQLGSADRYTESTTSVVNSKVVTTLSVTEDSGLREVLKSEWNPVTGITKTTVNGNEEEITTTPDYSAKTVKTESNKGWTRITAINNLGLATSNSLTGTGISASELKPVWRADGSLESVEFNVTTGPNNQKETHTASFKPDGRFDSLTAPGRGSILTSHTISNGTETLIVNGMTKQTSLDGTSQSTSGANVIGRSEVLTASGSGYQKRTTPATGAPTDDFFNAALAPTGKTYADATGEAYGYINELLATVTLARGGQMTLGYSNNGAKDLTAATWPAVASGPFQIPSVGVGFGYNRSGIISTQSDPSGTRTLGYLKGRLISTAYTAGTLKGYEILPGRDEVGRQNGTLIKRDGASIHSTAKLFNGVSDQVTDLASGNITATPQRDGAGRIIGYVWRDGSNTVNQTWTRSEGGRIEAAGSNVTGAPSFNYADGGNAFDASGRRLKCTTAGGTWVYVYGAGGQLASATHPTLGTFTYSFDGIGRRTDKGSANTTDILNQTTAWTNSQNKTVTIKAAPGARVWFNGVEIQNFSGTHQEAITSPGPNGGWVPWETLAVLEGQGQGAGNPAVNPLANPDAKAQKKGAVWVPPANETLTYDAAGNRQSSALWDLGWDAKNQLTRVRTKGYTTAPQAYDITFAYDTEGRRVRKQVVEYQNGVKVAEKIITFVWDGWDLLYERQQLPSGLTTLERKYLWGPDIADGEAGGAGGLLLIRETKGNTTTNIIPLYDGTGHVVALTDINKNLLASYAYGPFGEKISATGDKANSNPWRWATKYQDEETGFYYFGHRFYDPTTGQWLSREILGESESINLYQYCGNDPLNHVDVLGLFETQEQVDDIRVTVLLGMLNRNPNQLPVEFPQELKELCYLQNADKFGMTKPFGVEDYKRAIVYVEKAQACSGAMMSRNDHPDDQPSIRSGESMPPSAAFTLTMGLGAPCVNPAIAEFNGGLLIPFGIEGYALGGVIKTAQVTRILATGASIERALLIQGVGAELRTGAMVSSEASQMLSASTKTGAIVSKTIAAPNGQFYSIAFETTLNPMSYPGVSRYMHFKEANAALDAAIHADAGVAANMEKLGISIPKSPSGSILGKSPEGWVWHHDTKAGVMQLVPKTQHPNVPGGIFWETMHPGGNGGFSIWGK